jgi:hypothetical protein
MPSIGDQLDLPGAVTASFIVARALLRPGRYYTEAVDAFAPYDRIQDRNPELRADLVRLIESAEKARIPAYVLVNNRAEGSAPTIGGRILASGETQTGPSPGRAGRSSASRRDAAPAAARSSRSGRNRVVRRLDQRSAVRRLPEPGISTSARIFVHQEGTRAFASSNSSRWLSGNLSTTRSSRRNANIRRP